MTRSQLSDVWARRGDARDKLAGAELALLEALHMTTDVDLHAWIDRTLGSIAGAQALLRLATDRIEALAAKAVTEPSPDGESRG